MTGRLDLAGSTLLKFTGEDRVRWLNGQVTADVRKLVPGQVAPACVCNIKGQLDALIWITADADALWMQADGELRDTLPPRLERYIIADAVEMEDVSDSLSVEHFIGISLEEIQRQCGPGEWAAASMRLGVPGVDVWSPQGITHDWAPGLTDAAAMELRLDHRIPAWGRELTRGLLPAEARLDACCIAWDKGCYTGQEVVSRMKMAGKTNRMLERFVIDSGGIPEPGTLLMAGDQEAGVITSAGTLTGQTGITALGFVRRNSRDLPLLLADGRSVVILP